MMAGSARLGVCSMVMGCALLHATIGASGTIVAQGQDVSFRHPQVSSRGNYAEALGHIAVMERFHANGLQGWTDVVVLDLRAECNEDVLFELTATGGAWDPSVDGDFVAYVTAQGGSLVIHRVRHDLSQPETTYVDPVATSVRHLDLYATSAVYVRRAFVPGVGSRDQLVEVDMGATPPSEIVFDTAPTIHLADDRPAGYGYLRYIKGDPPNSQMWSVLIGDPGTPPWTLDSPGPPSEVVSSGSVPWSYAFVATVNGRDDVYYTPQSFPYRNLTNSTNPDWDIEQVAISHDGAWVAFVSNGDFAGENGDGSRELFRIETATGTIEQVTQFLTSTHLPLTFQGITLDRRGEAVLYSTGNCSRFFGCTPEYGANSFLVTEEDFAYPLPTTFEPVTDLVPPPFDVDFPATPCTISGGEVTCSAYVRNSFEGAVGSKRRVLVLATWDTGLIPPCSRVERPVLVADVPFGEQLTVTDTFPGCGDSGTFTVRVVQTDVIQADVAEAEVEFDF